LDFFLARTAKEAETKEVLPRLSARGVVPGSKVV
jgi:hypothetical protein